MLTEEDRKRIHNEDKLRRRVLDTMYTLWGAMGEGVDIAHVISSIEEEIADDPSFYIGSDSNRNYIMAMKKVLVKIDNQEDNQ